MKEKSFGINQEKINEAEDLFKKGMSIKDLANYFKVSTQTIRRIFKKYNIKEHRSYKWVNKTYFDNIDTEEKAYLLGFFVADGCIRKESDKRYDRSRGIRMCLTNSVDDSEIIKKFHEVICPNNKLLSVNNTTGAKNRKLQIGIQWTSYYMSDVLMNKYKILPNKTFETDFIFPFDTIPAKLQRHFIRGFLDGDGSIGKDGLRFCSTSKLFLNQIVNIFNDYFMQNGIDFHYTFHSQKTKNCNLWCLFISKGFEKQIILKSFLYHDATIYLTRKYNKIQEWKILKRGRPKKL